MSLKLFLEKLWGSYSWELSMIRWIKGWLWGDRHHYRYHNLERQRLCLLGMLPGSKIHKKKMLLDNHCSSKGRVHINWYHYFLRTLLDNPQHSQLRRGSNLRHKLCSLPQRLLRSINNLRHNLHRKLYLNRRISLRGSGSIGLNLFGRL